MTTVLDGHCHLASTRCIPPAFLADVAGNVACRLHARGVSASTGRIAEGYAAQHQDHDADGLVAEMDAAGVARAVLLIPDFSLVMEGAPAPEEALRAHQAVRARHPGRFWVYAGVDPRHGPEGLRVFERSVVEGMVDGVKLYPPCGYSPSDPGLYPYYEICAARSLPVFTHTGPTAGSLEFEPAHPVHIDRAARDFPGVDFVLGHAGLSNVEVASGIAAHRPNVYLDIGGFGSTPTLADWRSHLNRLFRLGLNHKIVFGTDWPLGRLSGGLRRLVEEVVDGPVVFDGVGRRDRELLLGGNLARLLAAAPGTGPAPADRSRNRDREGAA